MITIGRAVQFIGTNRPIPVIGATKIEYLRNAGGGTKKEFVDIAEAKRYLILHGAAEETLDDCYVYQEVE